MAVWNDQHAFFIYLYFVLIFAVRDSMATLSKPAGRTLQVAATLLMTVWVTYPLVYAIPVFFNSTPRWTVGIQIAFSVADVIAKVGFGALIQVPSGTPPPVSTSVGSAQSVRPTADQGAPQPRGCPLPVSRGPVSLVDL